MNTWLRRSLEASIVAAGFVVIGAGVANAAEPAHGAALPKTDQATHSATGLVGTVTRTAHQLTGGGAGTTRHVTPTHVSRQSSTVHSVTGLVHRTTNQVLGQRQAIPMRHPAAVDRSVRTVPAVKPVTGNRTVDGVPTAGDFGSMLNGVGGGALAPAGPSGSLYLSGNGETAGTLAADLGQAGALYGMSDTFGVAGVAGRGAGELAAGNVDPAGVTDAIGGSSDEFGGDLAGMGSLDGTAAVGGAGAALGQATGSLAQGDASGVLSAVGTADVATTSNGSLGSVGAMSAGADLSGIAGTALAAGGDAASGDVTGAGATLTGLDGSLDVVAEPSGVGTVPVTGAVYASLDRALVAAGNSGVL